MFGIILSLAIILTGCSPLPEPVTVILMPVANTTDIKQVPMPTNNDTIIVTVPWPQEGNIQATPLPNPPPPADKVNIPKDAPINENWLSPSKVEIVNFHAGGTAEYNITFHNAKQTYTEQKLVRTIEGDTSGEIPLKAVGLYKDTVGSIISITSNESTDKLKVDSYDKASNSIFVTGFAPSKLRVITFSYIPMTAYQVYVRLPDHSKSVSANTALSWATVQYPTMVLAPMETVNNLISITMPEGATLPDKNFELWVGVTEKSQSGGAALSLEFISRWIISMKESSVSKK